MINKIKSDPRFFSTKSLPVIVRKSLIKDFNLARIFFTIFTLIFSTVLLYGQGTSIDSTFNPRLTKVVTSFGATHLAVQPSGKIILFGTYTDSSGGNFFTRVNDDGTSDPTFNCDVCLSFTPYAVTIQPDGKIIVGGLFPTINTSSYVIIRLNPDGDRDLSFTAASLPGLPNLIVVQPDGKILVQYRTSNQGFVQYLVTRLNTDGASDNTFTTIAFGGGHLSYTIVYDMALQPDGKILIGGGSSGIGSFAWLRRFNSNGTPDNSFDTPSITDSDTSSLVYGITVQTDGSILVTGDFSTVNGLNRFRFVRLLPGGNIDTNYPLTITSPDGTGKIKLLPNGKFYLAVGNVFQNTGRFVRYNADGTVDNTFSSSTSFSDFSDWTIDSLGRIVFGGTFSGSRRYARLNLDGSLDTMFNPIVTVNATVSALAIQADGKVLVSGDFDRTNGVSRSKISRVNPDGSTDSSFNSGTGFDTAPKFIVVQADGKVLVGGSFTTYNGTARNNLARLNADGSLDTAFNPAVNSTVYSIAPLLNGQIYIGGTFNNVNGTTQAGFARLNADGSLDTAFAPLFGGSPDIRAIFVQNDGKIMVGGGFSGINGFNRSGLVRLNADGSLDTSFNAGSVGMVLQIIRQSDGKYLLLKSDTITLRNSDGTLDTSFHSPSIDGTLKRFLQQSDGTILIGGEFTRVDNVARHNFAHLSSTGALDILSYRIGTDQAVNDLTAQADGKVIVGGNFSNIENTDRTGIARITSSVLRSVTEFDYDADGKADVSVFRPSENKWYILRSSDFSVVQTVFALAGDIATPSDYDGDGKTDVAIFRPSSGDWWYQSSINNAQINVHWGQAGDIPRPADFDGDGKTDFVVFRPSTGGWYRLGSTGQISILGFGIAEDKPLIGDFDGDGKSDIAIFRPSTGDWWFASSITGQFISVHWGASGDLPAPADYDGDGKTDFAIYRPSNGGWYILNSSTGSITTMAFGAAEDKPIAADYDGDGKADIAVFRPMTGTWYLLQTTSGFGAVQWGVSTDIPTENAFLQ